MKRELYLRALNKLVGEIRQKSVLVKELDQTMKKAATSHQVYATIQSQISTVKIRLTLLNMLRCQLRVDRSLELNESASRRSQHLTNSRYYYCTWTDPPRLYREYRGPRGWTARMIREAVQQLQSELGFT